MASNHITDATIARRESIRKMWVDEGMTMKQIGAILGVTRAVVSGHIHRMDIEGRTTVAREMPEPKPPKPLPEPVVVSSAPESFGLTVMELEKHHCRFPYGDRNFTFCGRDKTAGSQYCIFHSRIVYAPKHPILAKLEGR